MPFWTTYDEVTGLIQDVGFSTDDAEANAQANPALGVAVHIGSRRDAYTEKVVIPYDGTFEALPGLGTSIDTATPPVGGTVVVSGFPASQTCSIRVNGKIVGDSKGAATFSIEFPESGLFTIEVVPSAGGVQAERHTVDVGA